MLRILVSHHSPLEMNDPTKRLKLLRKPDDSQALVSGLSRTAGINLVLSGDIHKSLIRPLDTGPDHKIYSVTAGTSRSSSRPQNCLAEFVLCGLTDLAPNNKFGRLTVVAFEYNNDTFERKNQFEGKSSISFPLHY